MVRTTSFTFPQSNGMTGQNLNANIECQTGESVVGGGASVDPAQP